MTVGNGSGPARVRRPVESLLSAAGVPFAWNGDCLHADLSAQAMTALEGRWAPGGSLLLVFDPEAAAAHPEADLVAPGSFRLERFLAWIRREVQVSRAYLPPLPPEAGQALLPHVLAAASRDLPLASYYVLDRAQVWEPHLVVAFLAARIGVERHETLHVPGINLVTGALSTDLRPWLPEEEGAPCGPTARRRLPYRRAYDALLASVARQVRAEDPAWAAAALRRYQEEEERLLAYYADLARENRASQETLAQLEANRQRRLREQRDRFRPRVLIRPAAVALLHVPVLNYSVLFCDGLRERRRTFTYDSLLGGFRPPSAPPAPPAGPLRRRPPNPPPGSVPPPPPAGWRWPR